MNENKICPYCKTNIIVEHHPETVQYIIKCPVCGKYKILWSVFDDYATSEFKNEGLKISSYIKEKNLKGITPIILYDCQYNDSEKHSICYEHIINDFPKTIDEKIMRIIENLRILSKFPGNNIDLNESDYPLLYPQQNRNKEIPYMLSQLYKQELIEMYSLPPMDFPQTPSLPLSIQLTHHAWEIIQESQKKSGMQ